ncbi:hypothetical protein AE02_04349, partial [Klebsiella variicola]
MIPLIATMNMIDFSSAETFLRSMIPHFMVCL